jgi:hypothetical protein
MQPRQPRAGQSRTVEAATRTPALTPTGTSGFTNVSSAITYGDEEQMNTDQLTKLADLIEVIEPDAFNLGTWWEHSDETICGTVGCLAGWSAMTNDETKRDRWLWEANSTGSATRHAISRKYRDRDMNLNYFPWLEAGQHNLGLTAYEADTLFTSSEFWAQTLATLGLREHNQDDYMALDSVTQKEAVIVLRALASGEIPLSYNTSCACDACAARR